MINLLQQGVSSVPFEQVLSARLVGEVLPAQTTTRHIGYVRLLHRQTDRWRDRHTDRQTDMTNRQKDRRTDRRMD